MDFEQAPEWRRALQLLTEMHEFTANFTEGEVAFLGRQLRETTMDLALIIAEESGGEKLSETGAQQALKQLYRLMAGLEVAIKLSAGSREASNSLQASVREFVAQLKG